VAVTYDFKNPLIKTEPSPLLMYSLCSAGTFSSPDGRFKTPLEIIFISRPAGSRQAHRAAKTFINPIFAVTVGSKMAILAALIASTI